MDAAKMKQKIWKTNNGEITGNKCFNKLKRNFSEDDDYSRFAGVVIITIITLDWLVKLDQPILRYRYTITDKLWQVIDIIL